MEELENVAVVLAETLGNALSERMVAIRGVSDTMQLLIYPADDAIIIGIGLKGAAASRFNPELLLKKRSQYLNRYGEWMPALLADGGWYIMRRLHKSQVMHGHPQLSQDELLQAKELLL